MTRGFDSSIENPAFLESIVLVPNPEEGLLNATSEPLRSPPVSRDQEPSSAMMSSKFFPSLSFPGPQYLLQQLGLIVSGKDDADRPLGNETLVNFTFFQLQQTCQKYQGVGSIGAIRGHDGPFREEFGGLTAAVSFCHVIHGHR